MLFDYSLDLLLIPPFSQTCYHTVYLPLEHLSWLQKKTNLSIGADDGRGVLNFRKMFLIFGYLFKISTLRQSLEKEVEIICSAFA